MLRQPLLPHGSVMGENIEKDERTLRLDKSTPCVFVLGTWSLSETLQLLQSVCPRNIYNLKSSHMGIIGKK